MNFSFLKTLPVLVWIASLMALAIAGALYIKTITAPTTQAIAVLDMQAVMDAQKLVWVKRMQEGDSAQVLAESRLFNEKLQKVLKETASDFIVMDQKAFIYGKEVQDLTPVVMRRLGLSENEVKQIHKALEDNLLGDFPTLRKARP
ncbi:MAG TPA: hypothetical protein IAC56_05940 [Candidatus Aphodousia faecigallinarum]|uniref:Uncharacterized protein n=1 Tax=Candidatus Aphodousia faecigallinarum TaxID=2840677 RepID=A0A9D1LEL9_9BURK|nr:hypothetical protein [Candidatus Aphodousia faecigallinarum]